MSYVGKDGTWYIELAALRNSSMTSIPFERQTMRAEQEWFALDRLDLERVYPLESADERLQRVERCMLAFTAEWMKLTGRAEPPMPPPRPESESETANARNETEKTSG